MKPIQFESVNVVFAKDQKEYLPLPAHRDEEGVVTTCWNFNWKERLKILFSGKMFLQMLSFNRPLTPVKPSVENPLI